MRIEEILIALLTAPAAGGLAQTEMADRDLVYAQTAEFLQRMSTHSGRATFCTTILMPRTHAGASYATIGLVVGALLRKENGMYPSKRPADSSRSIKEVLLVIDSICAITIKESQKEDLGWGPLCPFFAISNGSSQLIGYLKSTHSQEPKLHKDLVKIWDLGHWFISTWSKHRPPTVAESRDYASVLHKISVLTRRAQVDANK